MNNEKTLSSQYLERFDFEETKKNIDNYFLLLEDLVWEWTKLNTQKGLVANLEDNTEFQKQPYTPIGKDIFALSAKELKEEEIKKHIASYYSALNALTDTEQVYMSEYYMKRKYEDEIAELLDFESSDSRAFRNLKRSALYKFADYLGMAVVKTNEILENEIENEGMKI